MKKTPPVPQYSDGPPTVMPVVDRAPIPVHGAPGSLREQFLRLQLFFEDPGHERNRELAWERAGCEARRRLAHTRAGGGYVQRK